MAKKIGQEPDKKISKPSKKSITVRERTRSSGAGKPKRVRSSAGKVASGFSRLRQKGRKEYHLPLPDNKFGRILSKKVRFIPRFISNSWSEIRLVTWPNLPQTMRLTMAVFIFAVVFATIVGVLDYGLNKLFREVIIGQ